MNLFNKMFARKEASKDVARDRLKMVLVQDRFALAPATLERMKNDVVLAVSKYVEIDRGGIEFSWKDLEKSRAIVASIPVISVKRRGSSDDRTA